MIEKVEKIFEILANENQNPTTELYYTNNFTLLIAVILSAQSQDKTVNVATKKLFEIISMPQDVVNFGLEKLTESIKIIGLYKTKAKNIIGMSKILIELFNSEVPGNFEDLKKLPGVGVKTAYVILNTAFNKPVIAVDTHIFRISRRIGFSLKNTPEKVGEDLMNIVPEKFLKNAHHWLILHGRYVCTAKKPKCDICSICNFCQSANTF